MKQGRAGSTRTASDFGRAFPGVQIIESTAEQKNVTIKRSHAIVIATPGAEPQVDGGYSAVVILDAARMLARDSLRAEEDAVRYWSNAIASLSETGTAVVVGLEGALAKKLQSWDQIGIAAAALAERRALRFPPAVRIASLSAEPALLADLSEELKLLPDIEILGPVPVLQTGREVESKLIIRFEYSRGAELSAALKGISMRLSAGQSRFNPKSGRAMRPIRIKMDDPEVI